MSIDDLESQHEDAYKWRLLQAKEAIERLRIIVRCPVCAREMTLPAYISVNGESYRENKFTRCQCGEEFQFKA
jgi:hypothetical protein